MPKIVFWKTPIAVPRPGVLSRNVLLTMLPDSSWKTAVSNMFESKPFAADIPQEVEKMSCDRLPASSHSSGTRPFWRPSAAMHPQRRLGGEGLHCTQLHFQKVTTCWSRSLVYSMDFDKWLISKVTKGFTPSWCNPGSARMQSVHHSLRLRPP